MFKPGENEGGKRMGNQSRSRLGFDTCHEQWSWWLGRRRRVDNGTIGDAKQKRNTCCHHCHASKGGLLHVHQHAPAKPGQTNHGPSPHSSSTIHPSIHSSIGLVNTLSNWKPTTTAILAHSEFSAGGMMQTECTAGQCSLSMTVMMSHQILGGFLVEPFARSLDHPGYRKRPVSQSLCQGNFLKETL